MNIYRQRQRWKFLLFLAAVLIGVSSLWYTNQLVSKLSVEERKKAELLANAWTQIVNADVNDPDLDFYSQVIMNNESVPVIVTDSLSHFLFMRNLDSLKMSNPKYSERKLSQMKENNDPIIIYLTPTDKQYLYFDKSINLVKLTYFPYIQLIIILLFILVAYFAFSTSKKAEQNQVWVGLSKETAHQLGTPISSLLAWFEIIKSQTDSSEMLYELDKDLKRLEKITERFAKIGANPVLAEENIVEVIKRAVNYLQARSSDKVRFKFHLPSEEINIPINATLFEWVIENVCKNSIDAINGVGEIFISIRDFTQVVYIDISDTGKGISKSMYRTIFKPGFTTKRTGWGLGLSLAKRIVEDYHDGKIFVHQSEINKGTSFRIVLKK